MRGMVHTLSLLRVLIGTKYPLIFGKKATLVLVLKGSTRHLSVSVSIVYPPKAGVRSCLGSFTSFNFVGLRLIRHGRQSSTSVPGDRSGFFCRVTCQGSASTRSCVLLSMLCRSVRCFHARRVTVSYPFVQLRKGPLVMAIPSTRSVLNSGLATFTPGAAKVPCCGGKESYSVRVTGRLCSIKQLFRGISSLRVAGRTFHGVTIIRLSCQSFKASVKRIFGSVHRATLYVSAQKGTKRNSFSLVRSKVVHIGSFVCGRHCLVSRTVVSTTETTCLTALVRGKVGRVRSCSGGPTSVGSVIVQPSLPGGLGGLEDGLPRTCCC